MMTARRFLPVLITASALVGCNSARDEKALAEHAQNEVKEEAAAARNQLDSMEKKTAASSGARANEVVEELREAKAEARQASAEADAALARARADTRSAVESTLRERMKTVAELQRKIEKKLPKPEADRLVKDLTERATAVQESLDEIDRAEAITLEAAKRTAEQRLQELDQALDQARERV
ncbi:hypothetical protein WMF31_03135 [Sorangium sp. So ce1036]|uniref:hypothetical protein n=1 Tax=Sorangium sp. So ce1036 TaxID=3133328 RepID=UPI003F0D34BA